MDFEQKIRQFIKKQHMISKGAGIVVGLSGGADSVALLAVLCSLREEMALRLAAVHVHHGIRKEADRDVDFCRQLCAEKQVAFFAEYAKVPELARQQGLTVEEAGRQVRYERFEAYRKQLDFDMIAVAHHQNDQAETMLFQLFRGSGLRGLTGIPLKRGNIIRPLLAVTREEIEHYVKAKDLTYVTDSTNAEDAYARNKIRHHILPVAEEISPGAVEHMNQTGMQLRGILDYMEQQAAVFLEAHGAWQGNAYGVSVRALSEAHAALQSMVVLEAAGRVSESRKDMTARHVESILSLLEKDGEKTVYLPRGVRVVKRYDTLLFVQCREEVPASFGTGKQASGEGMQAFEQGGQAACASKQTSGGGKQMEAEEFLIEPDRIYTLSDGTVVETRLLNENNLENIPKSDCIKWFDYDKIKGVLSLRTRRQGDYLMVREDGARKSLQDYFVNEKIPKSERDTLKILADGQHILWVPGRRISAYYKVTKETKQILEVHIGGRANG